MDDMIMLASDFFDNRYMDSEDCPFARCAKRYFPACNNVSLTWIKNKREGIIAAIEGGYTHEMYLQDMPEAADALFSNKTTIRTLKLKQYA